MSTSRSAQHHQAAEPAVRQPDEPARQAEAASPLLDRLAEGAAGAGEAGGAPPPSLDRQAALLSKTNDAYHGGVAQRGVVARRLQRRLGNTAVQRIVQRAHGYQPLSDAAPADANRAATALAHLPHRGPHLQRADAGLQVASAPAGAARVNRTIQRDITGSKELKAGKMEIKMIDQNGVPSPSVPGVTMTGVSGQIKFTPGKDTPYSNKIGIVQILKFTKEDKKGTPQNADIVTLPALRGKQVRTAEDKKAGVEEGFFTDVPHQDFGPPLGTGGLAPQKGVLSPYYQFGPVGPVDQIFGFRRSPTEIKAAEIGDFPATGSKTGNFKWTFETVAKGDDNLLIYGGVKWSFGVNAGKLVNESAPVFTDDASATWTAALEKHRDFYTHEPVTFYFDFDKDQPAAGEADKIDTFLAYLTRNADVQLGLTGFADLRGKASYNQDLANRRANAIAQALLTKGIAAARIDPITVKGATDEFAPAKKESNFRANRRVMLEFRRKAVP